MFARIPKPLKIVLGSLLVGAGIIGLLLPILPGWLLIIPGALLLGFDVAVLVRYLKRSEDRWPRLAPGIRWLRDRIPHKKHEATSDQV
ncbi:MAG TPA: hypothetical protein VHV77_14705 [Pirellulales bacterium]|nr:hypothetical protein [Pirellulales bacterium]